MHSYVDSTLARWPGKNTILTSPRLNLVKILTPVFVLVPGFNCNLMEKASKGGRRRIIERQ